MAEEIKRTACYMCWQQCEVKCRYKDGVLKEVMPCPEGFVGGGFTCERVKAAPEFHYSDKRLNYPMKRTGERGEGKWERISWEQALDEIAAKLVQIRDEFGPEAITKIAGTAHGPADWASWRFFNIWGSPNSFNQGKNCGQSNNSMECAMYGWDSLGCGPVPGVTKNIVVWGANPAQSWATKWQYILQAQEQGANLIVIDPRLSETASYADLHVRLEPGTDGCLGWGLLHIIIKEDLYDHEFVENWCLDFDALAEKAAEYTPDIVAGICKIPEAQLVQLAHMYADGPTCLAWGLASCHSGTAGQAASYTQAALRAITGNVDRLGGNALTGPHGEGVDWFGGIMWDEFEKHAGERRDCVTAEKFPICSVKSLNRYNENIKKAWNGKGYGCSFYFMFPSWRGLCDAIIDEEPYPIKAMFIQTGNPITTLTNGKRTMEALEKVDLLVGMDFFMTPSMAMCDYVLPAASWLERDHLMLFWGLTNVAVAYKKPQDPLFERKDDYWFWKEIAKRVELGGEWPETLREMYDIFLRPSGKTLYELAESKEYWIVPEPAHERYRTNGYGFGTPSGKCELAPSIFVEAGLDPVPYWQYKSECEETTPEIAAEYPFNLISGSRVRPYHHSMYRELQSLRWMSPYPRVDIHTAVARELGIADGEWVYIETPLGRVRQMANVTPGIRPDTIHAEAYWYYPEEPDEKPSLKGAFISNINSIIDNRDEVLDYAGDDAFRAMRCKIYKADGAVKTDWPLYTSTVD